MIKNQNQRKPKVLAFEYFQSDLSYILPFILPDELQNHLVKFQKQILKYLL